MLVTVWRHGEAGAAPTDEERPLTPRGERSLAEAVAWFADNLLETQREPVSSIWYSPLVRTTQTADILAGRLGAPLVRCDGLAPGTDPHRPDTFMDDREAHLVLVTHQPFVSQLIWHWLDNDSLEPILPGGWATLELMAPTRGGGTLIDARTHIF